MKTIQTELQKIADAIKGTESEESVKTTQDLLAEIRDNIAGTTPSGEVKNMQVLLGEIAQAISDNPPSPAPETFEVEITGQGEPGSYTFSANKTYSETMTAIQNGDAVSFVVIANGQSINACGYFLMANTVDNSIVVVIAAEDTSVQYASCIKWTSGNTFEVLDLIPANG